jgi:hypothetical protein
VLPYEDALKAERRINTRPNPVVLIVLLLLVVGVVGGGATLLLLPRLSGTSQPGTGTPVAQATGQPGALVTGEATTPTAESGTAEPMGGSDLASLIQATNDLFVANQFGDAKADVVQSSLGDTLQVQVCGNAGPELQSDVYRAMDIVAEQAAKARDSLKAVGLTVTSCAQPDVTLYRAVASIEAVIRYVEGGMSNKRDYRAAWKRG